MGVLFWATAGAITGWIGSLVLRSGSSLRILADIIAGLVGGIWGPLLLGSGSDFDNLMAVYLGALVTLALVHLLMWLVDRRQSTEQKRL